MPASARSSKSILAAHFESDGQRRSEQLRRPDLKDESQPLISNLTTLCHPPGKPSGSPLSETSPKHPTFRSPYGRRHESPSAEPENIFLMSCECATRPGAQADTLRVLSECDTCPRVPPADTTLRKPPELPPVPSA